jgi:hypothetical protein
LVRLWPGIIFFTAFLVLLLAAGLAAFFTVRAARDMVDDDRFLAFLPQLQFWTSGLTWPSLPPSTLRRRLFFAAFLLSFSVRPSWRLSFFAFFAGGFRADHDRP